MSVASHTEFTNSESIPASTSQAQVALLYHELRAESANYSYALAKDRFDAHLDIFSAVKNMNGHYRPHVTFDDGHLSDFEYALPALTERELSAHFFITAGWTGSRVGYMAPQHLRVLHSAGHVIGAHGWSHTLLTQCNEAQLKRELEDARQALEDCISAPVTEISLPGGRGNASVLRACKSAGYTRVWTSSPSVIDTATQAVVGRFNILATHSDAFLLRLLDPESGELRQAARMSKLKGMGQRMLGDFLYAKLWGVLNHQESEAPDTARAGLER